MPSYKPINLGKWCNVGAKWIGEDISFPIGKLSLRGLPFLITANDELNPRFLGFGENSYLDSIEIKISSNPNWVIFAHRLLNSHTIEEEKIGRLIATYQFLFRDGTEASSSIRERFEIGVLPVEWGRIAMLAVPDTLDEIPDRDGGPWEQIGQRQTEVQPALPRYFYLWAWKNPFPDRELISLSIIPRNRPFMIAAITTSTYAEDPFGREPHTPIKITLKDKERADKPFDLLVSVDRGIATFPYPLTDDNMHEKDRILPGWGKPYQGRNSPAYSEVAAQPSATITLNQGKEEIASVRWDKVLEKGGTETDTVIIEIIDQHKNWVHVEVVDDETGKPVPCRVHFESPDGIPYQPHGHHNHLISDTDMGTWHIDVGGDVRLGHTTYAYIDGTCQGWLPRGKVFVEASKGFEYEPIYKELAIQPGQRELTLRLKRWVDMNSAGWYSGDSHVHFLSTLGASLEAQCEDLNVVNLLQSQWGNLFTNTEDFIGRPVFSQDGRTIVYTSQENRQHMLGHLILLGLKNPVMPWCSDGPGEAKAGGTMETTLSYWADACHEQGGTVILPHFPNPNCEPPALIATGRVDAVEMLIHHIYNHIEYYRYLNGGYRLPLVGGTDKMTSDVPVGLYRTYVNIPSDEGFNYGSWCKNLRLGRTFISSGPMLRFTVDGAQIGDTLQLSGSGGTVEVEAEAQSIFPIHTLEIVQDGRVVADTMEKDGTRKLHLRTRIHVEDDTWLIARVGGPDYTRPILHHDCWKRGVMAHTSPIYITVNDDWQMYSAKTMSYMLTLLHGGIEYIQSRPRQYHPGTVIHHHGEEDHLAYLERPFREAIEAVKHRMDNEGK